MTGPAITEYYDEFELGASDATFEGETLQPTAQYII